MPNANTTTTTVNGDYLYTLQHSHRFGETTHILLSKKPLATFTYGGVDCEEGGMPADVSELVQFLQIEFDARQADYLFLCSEECTHLDNETTKEEAPMCIRFEHGALDAEPVTLTSEWFQITYNHLIRDSQDRDVAVFQDGYWTLTSDAANTLYSDVVMFRR